MTPRKAKAGAMEFDGRQTSIDFEERVRRRAYELYEFRGGEHGRDLDDWLRAEAELMSKRNQLAGSQQPIGMRKSRSQTSAKKSSARAKRSKSSRQGTTAEE